MATGKFQMYKDKKGKFRFRLLAGNFQPILASEAYNTKQACKNGIEAVKKNGKKKTMFQANVAKNGKHYFNLTSGNKGVVGTSQMYASKDTLRNGIASVMKNANAKVEEV